ncbi:family 43 glycosylhydrolase [Streptomyces sp. NPDC102381]|uniref:family 43 glycosylhydrolase n=1 Tax=Streptomyces sp. NPDC102381 TaxID=3366164 RepID=UPI00382CF1F8
MHLIRKLVHAVAVVAIAATALVAAEPGSSASASPAAAAAPEASRHAPTIQNDSFWEDTDGNLIASQGGGVFKFGNTYYWYGVQYQEAGPYAASPTRKYPKATFASIKVYTSKDLVNWDFKNEVANRSTELNIPPAKDVKGDAFSRMRSIDDASWVGRMGVVYNEATRKYVLVTQMSTSLDTDGKTNAGLLFLESDSPTGDFTYANLETQLPGVLYQGTGDQTVFTDDDGSDYLVFSNQSGRAHTYVARLAPSDSLSVEPAVEVAHNEAGREGNAMFKANGHYYIASSDLHGWNASATHVIKSVGDDPQGPYGAETIMKGTEADYSHVSQPGFFFTVQGKKTDTVVYAGDRWAEFAWNGTGYNQWVPLSFDDDDPVFNSLSSWRLDARSGRWATGVDNNFILNPEFEADRVPVTTVTGWNTTVDEVSPSTRFVSNPTPAGNGTRHALTLGDPAGFAGGVSQENTVPRGTYTLTLSAKTTTGLDKARVRITDSRGRETTLDLRDVGSSWTKASLEGIKLPSGTATITIEAAAAGGGTVSVDGLALTRS